MIDQLNGICQHTMRRQISPDTDLIAVGLNANRALNIIEAFYLATGVELDVNIFYSHRSVRAIATAVMSGQPLDPGKIVRLREGDANQPLFLYAGGVSCFLEMQDMIEALNFPGMIYGIRLTDFDQSQIILQTSLKRCWHHLQQSKALRRMDPIGWRVILSAVFLLWSWRVN